MNIGLALAGLAAIATASIVGKRYEVWQSYEGSPSMGRKVAEFDTIEKAYEYRDEQYANSRYFFPASSTRWTIRIV